MSKKFYDVERMARIIHVLVNNFGDDELVNSMINHLIRDESDYLVPTLKSKGVEALEQEYENSLEKLPRNAVWPKSKELSSKIVLEHGFTINEAIKQCIKAKDIKKIIAILDKIKKGLIYITKDENEILGKKGFSKNRKKGFLEAYKECNIELIKNE